MSIAIDRFIDEVTHKLYKNNFPFVCWEINSTHVELTVIDHDENRIREVMDRRLVEQYSSRDFAEYVVEAIVRRFMGKKYEKPYEFDVKKWTGNI